MFKKIGRKGNNKYLKNVYRLKKNRKTKLYLFFLAVLLFCVSSYSLVKAMEKTYIKTTNDQYYANQMRGSLLENFKQEIESVRKEDANIIVKKLKNGELDENQYLKAKQLIEYRNEEFKELGKQLTHEMYIPMYEKTKQLIYMEFNPYIDFFKQYEGKSESESKLNDMLKKSFIIIETKNEIRNKKVIEKLLLNLFRSKKITHCELFDRTQLLYEKGRQIQKLIKLTSDGQLTQQEYELKRDKVIAQYQEGDLYISIYHQEMKKFDEYKKRKFKYIEYLYAKQKINEKKYFMIKEQYRLIFSKIRKCIQQLKDGRISYHDYSLKVKRIQQEMIPKMEEQLKKENTMLKK